jgi:hypothetical protein
MAGIKVRLNLLHHPNPPYTGAPSVPITDFEGQTRWVGPPVLYQESLSGGGFYAAKLQCEPYERDDWNTFAKFNVYGTEIVPSSEYSVYLVPSNGGPCSKPVQLYTARWGDVAAEFNPPSETQQPDISDVSALVDRFRNVLLAIPKAQAYLAGEPGNPFGELTHGVLSVPFGFGHISACVDAFRGGPYIYTIRPCPQP